ncbi:MAG: hormogonium polysaccharide secretion pseudopilin HpsB [Cyanobacteriota bacterium]|nr:hormogonium polysaccharide secretion pseudopilin HpsB [Cyanobacteriota bacterium]
MNFKLKLLQHLFQDESQGLTIIEGLLAIIIVTILIVAIGPVLAFAAATRIHARRVELASQAATAYLDGVRSGSIDEPPIKSVSVLGNQTLGSALANINAPTAGSLDCTTAYDYCGPAANDARLYCVDSNWDGDCKSSDPEDRKDFIVQAAGVRANPPSGNNPPTVNLDTYLLGIRVYRADSFGAGINLLTKGRNDAEHRIPRNSHLQNHR